MIFCLITLFANIANASDVTLISPKNNSISKTAFTNFSWDGLNYSSKLEVSTSPTINSSTGSFENLYDEQWFNDYETDFSVSSTDYGYLPGTLYWHVLGSSYDGDKWSEVWSYQIIGKTHITNFSASPKSISKGESSSIKGQLANKELDVFLPKNKIKIRYRTDDNRTWKKLKNISTGPKGTFKFKVKPNKTTYYNVVFKGNKDYSGCYSKILKVVVGVKATPPPPPPPPNPPKYVASKIREPFHYTSCYWAGKISSENKVYYQTREAAIADGHRPCKVCNP